MKKNKFILYLMLCFGSVCQAKQVHIVVIDSGYTKSAVPNAKICKEEGVIDLTGEGTQDDIGHGVNIVGIISDQLKDIDYCLHILKVYGNFKTQTPRNRYFAYALALIITNHIHPDLINYSSSGKNRDIPEKYLIKSLTDNGIIFVTSAGNDGINLDSNCIVYPACYSGVISVGNLRANGRPNSSSNFGKRISAWAIGTNIYAGGITMSGTSQATAFVTSAIALKLSKGK